jgi:hypothetical protein
MMKRLLTSFKISIDLEQIKKRAGISSKILQISRKTSLKRGKFIENLKNTSNTFQ